MMKDGIRTGEATSTTDTTGAGKGVYKFENTAKIFLNDELDNGMSWHGELNIVRDTKAIDDFKGHETNTQRDFLRELYVDTKAGDWDVRLGKQQVVWGTADGIKLLDMVNPTDWSEFNQNTMADARIPLWMVNAEKYNDDGSNIQVIISEAGSNKLAGFDSCKDQSDAPFIMKGVDAICGQVNGFYNIVPALSNVAGSFNSAAYLGVFYNNPVASGLLPFGGMTVNYFASNTWNWDGNVVQPAGGGAGQDLPGSSLLWAFAQGGFDATNFNNGIGTSTDLNANNYITNLTKANGTYDAENPTSAFEYMPFATFSTFNSFSQQDSTGMAAYQASLGGDGGVALGAANAAGHFGPFTGTTVSYKKDLDDKPNIGGRFKNTLPNGMNYSINFFNHSSNNPAMDLDWVNSAGTKLTVQRAAAMDVGGGYYAPNAGTNLTARSDIKAAIESGLSPSILLSDGTNYYGAFDPTTFGLNANTDAPILQFTESNYRVNSLGGSFDYAIETESNPIVLRGEFIYEKGEKQPVVDRMLMAIGDISNALKMEDADYFKYVIGADTTVMTDMMLSGQFIQFRNLDYIDSNETCTVGNTTINCSRYTADFATLSLSNGLNQARENQNFYSVFLSKPFGESGEGRWNNIFIYEAGGGKWNRFDVEYGFDDQLIGTFEVNKYFGDENTMFGQFENASNIQIGLKYLLQ
jgi:hypothetical protein